MKAKYFLMMAASTLLLSNCSQEEALNQVQGGTNTLTATIEGSSRSAVTDGGVFSWTVGDAISVWNGENFVIYANTTGNSFSTEESEPGTPTGYAIYPANENHSIDGTTVVVNLPSSYGDTDTEYAANTNAPMLATIGEGSNTLAFKHLGGVMRFIVKDVPVGVTSFAFTANKVITGDFELAEGTDNNKVIEAGGESNSNNTVTINFKAPTTTSTMTFYVPLPVGEYGNYTVKVGEKSHESIDVTNTIARGTLLLMPVYTYTDSELTKDGSGSYVAMEGGEQTLATGDGEVLIDAAGLSGDAEAVLNLNYTPSADNATLTISDGSTDETESTESVATVNINPQGNEEVETLTINAPTLTVNLASGTYGTVEAKTATETLVIGQGVTIEKLTVKGGNIELSGNATVNNLVIPAGVEMNISLNGYTLTLNTENGQGIDNSGTLSIQNGKVVRNTLSASYEYAIYNREGAIATLDACEVVGPVFNVGTMTVQNESSLTTDAADRAALICGYDTVDKAWNFTMTGGKIESKQHSAAVLKNNYWGLNPQGLAKFDGVTFTGTTYYDIVLCVVNVDWNNCTLTNDKVWLKADGYVSIVNGTSTTKQNLVGCSWEAIYGSPITTAEALTKAIDNALTDGTVSSIVLGDNISISSLTIAEGKNILLDLNGNTLTLETTSGQGIDNSGTLTIQNGKVVRNTLSASYEYAIYNREGAIATLDACEVVGPVFNVGTMTVQNNSSLTTDATDRAALICGYDTVDKAWNFTMTGGKIESKQHSAAVLKNNYWELNPQGLAKFDGVTFTGHNYYDIVLCVVNVDWNNCTLTNDKVWLKADGFVSIVNETETKKENLVGCGWDDIFPASAEE